MGARRWLLQGFVGCWIMASVSGCMSMEEHRRVQARNRMLTAERETLAQDLVDARTANESMRARLEALDREMSTKGELIANLRSENEVLDEMRLLAQSQLEGMAGRQGLGDITIAGQALPEPLDTALRRFAEQNPEVVAYDANRGTMKWKSDLVFAIGSDVIKQSSRASLKAFADIIKSDAAKDFEVIIVGHTDNTPIGKPSTKKKHPTNWHLSVHRAISVASNLRRSGYGGERVGIMGFGEYRPIADNATAAGRSQNRRVEIFLVPRGTMARTSIGMAPSYGGEALASKPVQP